MTTIQGDTSLTPQKSTTVRAASPAEAWLRAGFSLGSRLAPGITAAGAAELFRRTRRSRPRPGEREVLRSASRSRIGGMAVWSWGRGPIVLLVHGWNGRATQLGALVGPLTDRGYRVVAFDALGHGESAGARSSLPELAMCIRQIADELGGVHAVVAHSLGGAATTFALAYGLRAERAVFIAPPADPRQLLQIFGRALGIGEEVRSLVRARVERRLGVPMDEMQVVNIATTMQIPLLVVHDRDDKEVPLRVGREVARAWPGADLLVTTGLGHQRILRDPRVKNAVVSFVGADERPELAA